MLWSDRTWPEIPQGLEACKHAAILPVGAIEQHGPHLGCGMDAVLAGKLCHAAGESTGVLVLPCLPYGCSLGHSLRWPGTITLTPQLLIEVVNHIGKSAYHSGVRRFFIVNAHVGNAAALRCALDLLRSHHDDLMVALINTPEISARVREMHISDGEDWHANDAETSLMLAIAPELVRRELCEAADDPDRTRGLVFSHPVNRTSANGVTGRPGLATEEKGRRLFDWMVEDLSSLIVRGLSETPPLAHSYFHRQVQ
jgi:creatinine amidohydrolase